jgi:hypothetical protein
MNSVISWLRQATTGAGFSALAGTAVAMASGQITWQAGAPLIVGGLLAIAWPEKPAAVVTDVEQVVTDTIKLYEDVRGQPAAPATTAAAK